MNTINPDPGDNWRDLTSDELHVELIRGLDKIREGFAIIAEGESHAALATQLLDERSPKEVPA